MVGLNIMIAFILDMYVTQMGDKIIKKQIAASQDETNKSVRRHSNSFNRSGTMEYDD